MASLGKRNTPAWQGLSRSARVLLLGSMLSLGASSVGALSIVTTPAGLDGPTQTAYAPEQGAAPVVIVISGSTGPDTYQDYAADVADLGYYAVLLTGREMLNPGVDGVANLRAAIVRAQHSPHALPGKVAVIGFSLGGGAALANAAGMSELVSMVVAYYPFTSFKAGPASLVRNFKVPVLLLAAERDRYKNCCLIESAHAMADAAKASGIKFELVVYPLASHGFNHVTAATGEPAKAYRADDAADAWRRTVEMLRQYQPLKSKGTP
jgi:dienelactone hydrolase